MIREITECCLPNNILIRIYRDGNKHVFHAVDDDSGETIERTFYPTLEQAQNRMSLYKSAAMEPVITHSTAETAIQTSLF